MRFAITILLLAAVAVALVSSAKGSTKASLKKKPTCVKECADDYTPVCAGDGTGKGDISFGNECVLTNYNCENQKDLKVVKKGECPGGGGVRLS